MINKPIFLLGAHKSGSSLLRSLFDGHPDLFTIPLETHVFQLANYWVDYKLRRTHPPVLNINAIKKRYRKWIEHYNEISDPLADSNLINCLNIRKFDEVMVEDASSFNDLVSNYYRGIYHALYEEEMPSDLRVVEKSVEHAEYAQDLRVLFPNSIFIHIIRNPYSNLVSFRRYLSRQKKHLYPFIGQAILCLYNNYYSLYRNIRLLDDYLIVRYEDLISKPEKVMRKISQFIEIDFQKNLLEPTVLGKSWDGNSSRGLKFSGISTANLDIWKSEINHLEIFYINHCFSHVLGKFDYDKLSITNKWMVPVWKELPHIYVLNRVIRYFL